MIYLSGTHSERMASQIGTAEIGLIIQPGNRYGPQLHRYRWWAADNGCYAKGDSFRGDEWMRWLSQIGHQQHCLFAVAPDVLGDAEATAERSRAYLPQIRQLGYKAALVAQNGCAPASLPWDEFDVLFLGGTTEWKLSTEAAQVAHEAHRQGKHVHMGRVNSGRRLRTAKLWACDSVDGTFLAFRARKNGQGGPDRGVREIAAWLRDLREAPSLPLTWCRRAYA